MKIQQLSIFLENSPGKLADIALTLGEIGVNIRAMALADPTAFGVLRLIVNDTAKAKQALRDLGYAVQQNEVIAVELEDHPGQLGQLLDLLQLAQINVESVYGHVQTVGRKAVLIFRLNDMDKGIEMIEQKGYRLLEGDAFER